VTKMETVISKADLIVFKYRPLIICNMQKQSLNPAESGCRSQYKSSTKRRALCLQKQQFPLANENAVSGAYELLCVLILFHTCSLLKHTDYILLMFIFEK
jgi:hypothetical protein